MIFNAQRKSKGEIKGYHAHCPNVNGHHGSSREQRSHFNGLPLPMGARPYVQNHYNYWGVTPLCSDSYAPKLSNVGSMVVVRHGF